MKCRRCGRDVRVRTDGCLAVHRPMRPKSGVTRRIDADLLEEIVQTLRVGEDLITRNEASMMDGGSVSSVHDWTALRDRAQRALARLDAMSVGEPHCRASGTFPSQKGGRS